MGDDHKRRHEAAREYGQHAVRQGIGASMSSHVAGQVHGEKYERGRIVDGMRRHAQRLRNDDGSETVSSILMDEEADAIESGDYDDAPMEVPKV